MSEFSDTDSRHFKAAQGWLELGNHLEANEELEQMSPQARAHPDVLELRWQIYSKEKKWEPCVEIGLGIMRTDPHRSSGWVLHSYALHELKRTEMAYTHLATVAEKFAENWTIPYCLACYCSQLGRTEEAQDWFKKAVVLNDKHVPDAGLNDPLLKPMWDSLSTIFPRQK